MDVARHVVRWGVLAVVLCNATMTRAANDPTKPPDVFAPPAPSTLTPEQQSQIIKAFRAAEPALRKFATRFPGAGFSMVHPEPKSSQITIATVVDFGDFGVSLVFSGTFSGNFERLLKSRCEFFGAYDNREKAQQRPSRRPHPIRLEEMDAFCADPDAFLQQLFGTAPTP